MPAHTSPFKTAETAPAPEHRLRMCELAVEGLAGVSACALEVRRGGTSYTVDTLRELHASHAEGELTFIVGADTASTLGSWREPAALLELARLAVAVRTGTSGEQVRETIARLQAGGGRATVAFLDMPAIDISSSLVRERVAEEQPIDGLVAPAVARYIGEHSLYQARAGAIG
jgi:nicotinate-nucleotide adenylyltransferase